MLSQPVSSQGFNPTVNLWTLRTNSCRQDLLTRASRSVRTLFKMWQHLTAAHSEAHWFQEVTNRGGCNRWSMRVRMDCWTIIVNGVIKYSSYIMFDLFDCRVFLVFILPSTSWYSDPQNYSPTTMAGPWTRLPSHSWTYIFIMQAM